MDLPLSAGKKSITITRILKAAASVFSESGFSGARVDEIAKRAGVNKATIYYHIGDKEKLYAEVISNVIGKTAEMIAGKIKDIRDPEEKLRVYVRAFARNIDDNPQVAPVMMREVASGGKHLPEVVAQELDGLMKLKPALAQFLIYGPVPGTPFYERIIKENLLQDVYTNDKDLFYRRADGFRTMIKHPTLSPEQIEDIQRWCFEQDFQRLGPSIYRVLEARLLGYQKLKDSPNPILRAKAD